LICSPLAGIFGLDVISGILNGFGERFGGVFGASDHDVTLSILQPAVRDGNGIIDGPSTESTESDGLDDSEDEVSEVESVEGNHTHGEGESGSDPVVRGLHGGDGGGGFFDGFNFFVLLYLFK
jgi:hypothetical protein